MSSYYSGRRVYSCEQRKKATPLAFCLYARKKYRQVENGLNTKCMRPLFISYSAGDMVFTSPNQKLLSIGPRTCRTGIICSQYIEQLMHLIISNSIFSRAFFGAGYFNAKKCFQILRKVTVTVCYGSSRAFFCLRSVLFCQKLKNNVRNILFVSTPIRIGENNRRFVKDCFVKRRIVKIVYRDVLDKMADSSKLSLRYSDSVNPFYDLFKQNSLK
jgi:hypothetical protein